MTHSDVTIAKIPLLGVPISRLSLDEAVAECHERIQKRKGGTACFVNVHTLTESQSREDLKAALSKATFSFADGLPLVWLSKLKKGAGVHGRVCGPDFMERFLRRYPKIPYGFIGGKEGVADQIQKHFGIDGVSFSPTYRPFSEENALRDWNAFLKIWRERFGPLSDPQIVWVGLGAPKQELWVETVRHVSPHTLFLAVGAAFDFHSGTVKRAPRVFQKLGLEWCYRLFQEPRRLWSRYLKYNSRFLQLSLRDMFTESTS